MDNKPISIILDDFKKELANQINQSGLALCLVEPILKDLYEEVRMVAAQQLEQDRQNWNKTEESAPSAIEKMEGETES